MKPFWVVSSTLIVMIFLAGCGPMLVGSGATGAYKVATDERTPASMWDDTSLSAAINAELVKDPHVSSYQIDVDVYEREAVLTGVVESHAEAVRAVEIARHVAGVKSVSNCIQIGSRSLGQNIDDKIILTKIKSNLIKEPGIRSLNIDVDVTNGIVILKGIVRYGFQKDSAITIARTTDGVKKVVSYLKVSTP